MKRFPLLLVFLFLGNILIAQTQKTCEESETILKDLNGLDKCFAENSRELVLKNSQNNRFLTVRKKTKVSSLLDNINSKGLEKAKNLNSLKISSITSINNNSVNEIEDIKVVDKVPTFKACKKVTEDALQRRCFNSEMKNFISENIEYPKDAINKSFIGNITVKFIIDVNGKVKDIKTQGSEYGVAYKKMARKLVSKLPKFLPAKKNDKSVPVAYEFSLKLSE